LRSAVTAAGGRITALRVKPGDHVDAAQVVAELDPLDLRRRIALAEFGLRDAQARFNALAPGSENSAPLKAAVAEAEGGLAVLKGQLERDAHVLAPVAGTVVDVAADPADVVPSGTDVVRVRPLAADSEPLVATFYTPLNDAKRFRTGMRVDIAPAGVAREEYGSITGRIASVGVMPVTSEAMVRRLQSRQLAEMFLSAGPMLEVTAALDADRATPSAYHWTSSRGPAERLTPDTPCRVSVTVRSQPLLTLLVPATRRLYGKGN
jgi:HlyD family secretion protein